MSDTPFISYAQNAEDVVLWRALGHIKEGRYVDVGANHPSTDSVTRAFYDRGWRGITIEPLGDLVELHRANRPRDLQVHAVAADIESDVVTLHSVPGTGLSTIIDEVDAHNRDEGLPVKDVVVEARTLTRILSDSGAAVDEIHFMVIDVEGAEGRVLAGLDLKTVRPWVLVVESTRPNTQIPSHEEWEADLIADDYVFCLFDGLSRFYVAQERREMLAPLLSYPASVLDDYVTVREEALRVETARLQDALRDAERQTIRWRHKALVEWAELTAAAREDVAASLELKALHQSLSWRVTEPLRSARRVIGRLR